LGHYRKRSVPVLPRAAAVLVAVAFLAPALARAAEEEKPKKGKRPGLELRFSPRFAFSPADILFTAELKGGDDVEEVYCPEVEWEWGDGGKSIQEADCDPWTPTSKIERRFSSHHVFQFAGLYRTVITLRKSGKSLMSQAVQVTVRAGLGDMHPDPGN
jgi:hypothetical protein